MQPHRVQLSAERNPRTRWPALVGTAGGVQTHRIRCRRQMLRSRPNPRQPIVALGQMCVAQRSGGECAVTFDGVQVAGHGKLFVVPVAGERLANTIAVVAGHRSLRPAGDQRAFHQPLRVEH